MAILRSIKFTSALAALALFFLPWLDIQCSGKSMASQTGIQTITGHGTPAEELQDKREPEANQEPMGTATFVAVALSFALAGSIVLLAAIFKNQALLDGLGSVLCGLALALLIVQAIQGFPVKQELVESISADQATHETDMGSSIAMLLMANIQVKILPAFHFTCVLLGIPVLLGLLPLLMRLGKTD